METLNSSWPCDGGMSNQCIQEEFMNLDAIQNIMNIVIHFIVDYYNQKKMQFRIIDALFDPKAKINWFFNHAYVHFSYY